MDKKEVSYTATQAATVTFEIVKNGSKFVFLMPQVCNLQEAYDSLREITADLVKLSEEVVARDKKKEEVEKKNAEKGANVEKKEEKVTK